MREFAKQAWWLIRQVPVTSFLVLATIIVAIATKSLWTDAETSGLVDKVGYGLPAFQQGDWLNVITGMFIAPVPIMYLMIIALLIAGAGYLEYKYGAIKMLITLFVAHVGAVAIVALVLYAFESSSLPWARELAKVHDVGLSNCGFGALGAATAGFALIWRQRVRLLAGLYLFAMVLFSGLIWDLTHFVAFLIGLALGPWVVGRAYQKPHFKLGKQESRSFVAAILVFYSLCSIITKVYPGNGGLLSFGAPEANESSTMLLVLGTAFFFLIMAYGLYVGRRIAWRITVPLVTLMVLVTVASLFVELTALSVFDVIVTVILFISMIVFRKNFDVKPDKYVRRKIYRNLVLLAVGLAVFNFLAIHMMRSSFSPQPSVGQSAVESVYQIVGISSRDFYPTTAFAKAFTDSISYLWLTAFFISVGAIVFTTYRSREGRGQFAEYDKLLHGTGGNSISWMTRWQGISYWVNSSQTAGFAFRLENNVAIVLSDPIGSRQAVGVALEGFERMCARHGWRPVYYGVTKEFLGAVKRQKFKKIIIGEDTIVDLPQLEFAGKSWQSVRSSINRASKEGVRMRAVKLREAPVGLRDQLHAIAKGWVDDKSLPEMGFTLGTLKEAEDPEVLMHIAVDQDGTVHGMTSWMPVFKKDVIVGWTIDIMQRRLGDATMQGVIEFLIAESAMAFKQQGYEFISLSAAPLSHSGKASNAIEKLLDIVAVRMEPYYGFKSLFNFKKKFNPRHEPMYLCYRDEAQLPAIALALGKAYMPDIPLLELIKPPKKK
ncbi:MAG: phosphatidylglycerol lysyltransferase domain-containing protein [Candidatus Saccharimonadales bacterium]